MLLRRLASINRWLSKKNPITLTSAFASKCGVNKSLAATKDAKTRTNPISADLEKCIYPMAPIKTAIPITKIAKCNCEVGGNQRESRTGESEKKFNSKFDGKVSLKRPE